MRPSRDEWALQLALLTARRATCLRRRVGCVLLNSRGHVLSTGYNGVAAGQKHCNDHDAFDPLGYPWACEGSTAKSGTNLDACQAIHAEQNALMFCSDIMKIDKCFVTVTPCLHCIKMLMNTGCEAIIFAGNYAQADVARVMWTQDPRRKWVDA